MAALTTLVGGSALPPGSERWDDGQCVAAALRGDPSGFGELYARHRPGLLGRARRKWRLSDDIAEDAVHDTWVRALEHIHAFDSSRAFEPWVFRILDNVVIDLLRRRRLAVGQAAQSSVDAGELIDLVADERAQDADRVADREALSRAMAALPTRQQQTAMGVLVSGLTLDEAAQELHLSNSACRQLLHRARLSLRRTLLEGGVLPAFVPPLLGIRRRVTELVRRLGLDQGTALAGSGSTMVAVMLTVTVSIATVDMATARPREAVSEQATAQAQAGAVDVNTPRRRPARPHGSGASRPARARAAEPAQPAPRTRTALLPVPAARVPTGHGVHSTPPENPDYDYSVGVKAPAAEARAGVVAERHGATAPAHEAACAAANDLPLSRCERPARR